MQKDLPVIAAVILLVGGGAFYGGMKFGEANAAKNAPRFGTFDRGTQRGTQNGAFGGRMMGGTRGDDFANGEIIAKDAQSITIKLRDGGSRIVFLPETATVSKMTTGTRDDLSVGIRIMATGSKNTDGSLTAKNLQLLPENILPPEEAPQAPKQ